MTDTIPPREPSVLVQILAVRELVSRRAAQDPNASDETRAAWAYVHNRVDLPALDAAKGESLPELEPLELPTEMLIAFMGGVPLETSDIVEPESLPPPRMRYREAIIYTLETWPDELPPPKDDALFARVAELVPGAKHTSYMGVRASMQREQVIHARGADKRQTYHAGPPPPPAPPPEDAPDPTLKHIQETS